MQYRAELVHPDKDMKEHFGTQALLEIAWDKIWHKKSRWSDTELISNINREFICYWAVMFQMAIKSTKLRLQAKQSKYERSRSGSKKLQVTWQSIHRTLGVLPRTIVPLLTMSRGF